MASRTRELESPWEYCAQILPPPSKLSQHTVQEARWNNELLLLPGQTKTTRAGGEGCPERQIDCNNMKRQDD